MSKPNRWIVRGHTPGLMLTFGGILVLIVGALVYGPSVASTTKFDSTFMYYTLLVIGLACVIGGLTDFRLESIEGKIDELKKRTDESS